MASFPQTNQNLVIFHCCLEVDVWEICKVFECKSRALVLCANQISCFTSSGCSRHGSVHVHTVVFIHRASVHYNSTTIWLQYHTKYAILTTTHFFPCSSNTGGFLAAAAVGFGATTAGFGLSGTGPVFLRFLFLWVFSSSFTFLSPVRKEEMGLYCCVL